MAELAIGDRIALSGGYDAYPSWDPQCRPDKKWPGTVIAFLESGRADHDVVVKMDEPMVGDFDAAVLARRHVGTSWRDDDLVVMVALTRQADRPEAWSRSRLTTYVEACATLHRA